jgi:hypothetical protein
VTFESRVALAATLHDPDDRFHCPIEQVGTRLSGYVSTSIAATASTDKRSVDALEELGAVVIRVPDGVPGEGRRTALQMAMQSSARSILSCDFDRWLHWASTYPDELGALPHRVSAIRPGPWYVCLGRTLRAHATHPKVQQETERLTNHALSLAVGLQLDATAGASWLSRAGAELVIARSTEPSNATDLEWPAIVYAADPTRLATVALEGLEFETASFFEAEIEGAGGREHWIEAVYEQPQMWSDRLRLAADSVSALTRILSSAKSESGGPQS